jgi:hypothetical protein
MARAGISLFGYFRGSNAAGLEAPDKVVATRPRAGNLSARIYGSICLAETGRTQEIMKLVEIPAAAKNADLLTEYIQLLYETDRSGPALQRIDEALSISPRVSKQHLWRARIVLQMKRVEEAARKGEEAERLAPQAAVRPQPAGEDLHHAGPHAGRGAGGGVAARVRGHRVREPK